MFKFHNKKVCLKYDKANLSIIYFLRIWDIFCPCLPYFPHVVFLRLNLRNSEIWDPVEFHKNKKKSQEIKLIVLPSLETLKIITDNYIKKCIFKQFLEKDNKYLFKVKKFVLCVWWGRGYVFFVFFINSWWLFIFVNKKS